MTAKYIQDENIIKITDHSQIKSQLATIAPELYSCLEQLDAPYPLYIARYRFGESLVENGHFHLPNPGQAPFATKLLLVLDRGLESYLNLPRIHTTLALNQIMPGQCLYVDPPEPLASLCQLSSGSRHTFMLSSISRQKSHKKLCRRMGITLEKPRNEREHFALFRRLNQQLAQPWQSEVLLFDERWFQHQADPAWQGFYHAINQRLSPWRAPQSESGFAYQLIESQLQHRQAQRNASHISQTVNKLWQLGCKEGLAYSPATDDQWAPVQALQQLYIEDYQLENYPPTIMHLTRPQKAPIYYSLQFPLNTSGWFARLERESIINEMMQIISLINRQKQHLKNHSDWGELSHHLPEFNFVHSEHADYRELQACQTLQKDKRFMQPYPDREFPCSALFFKGCISVNH